MVERRAAGGPEDNAAAGPWLRLVAIGASVATASVAASGSLGLAHRALVLAALPLLAALVAAAWVAYRSLLARATAAVGLFLVEVGTGAVAWLAPGYWASLLHVAFATAAFAATLLAAAAAFRGPAGRSGPWRDYVTLTKPRIMTLLLLTGAAGMFVGARGVPPLGDLTAMLLGLALACGGASALNHYLDRDIDRLMGKRTQARPVASGRVPPERALEFGLCLSAFSFVVLTSLANPLTAALALAGNLFYVVVYTGWLKRRTPQNIVIGGAAGAVPPLVGWSAATGDLTLPALFLFLVVFVWTPPHFWALALLIRKEYERAAVPMLPVVRGERETTRQILLYTAALVGLTFLPLAWAMFGLVYVVAATLLGAGFLTFAWRLRRSATPRRAAVLFHYSLVYLALLFVAMAIDPIVVA